MKMFHCMKKKVLFLLFLMTAGLQIVAEQQALQTPQELQEQKLDQKKRYRQRKSGAYKTPLAKKPLTFLVYIAADNNLYPYVQGDLYEMMGVGSNENINILVYLNTRYPDEDKISQKLVIQKGYIEQDGSTESYDSGSPDTVYKACQWAHESFPSDNFVLVLWDHGSGALNRILGTVTKPEKWWAAPKNSRAICYDDTTGSFLTDKDLRSVLKDVCNDFRNGEKIEIVAFDACLMADIEVAYTIAPHAKYMVASQETIPGAGYGYDYALTQAADGQVDPKVLVGNMVHAYGQEYEGVLNDYTLSAVDLAKLGVAVTYVDKVAKQLKTMLSKSDKKVVKQAITGSRSEDKCTSFDDGTLIDIINFYTNLKNTINKLKLKDSKNKKKLVQYLGRAINYVHTLIIANVKGSDYPNATGLSIYFDPKKMDKTYAQLLWSKKTSWDSFLKQYYK